MKKLLYLCCLLIVLVACQKEEVSKNEPVTLNVWYTAFEQVESANGPINPWEAGIKYIEEKYPNIKINASFTTNDTESAFQKLETAIQGGTAPDVVLMFDLFIISTWTANGYLEDITEMVEAEGLGEKVFCKGPWEEFSFEDRIYVLPL